MPSLKTLFMASRPQYLLLSVLLVVLGGSVARHYGAFHWGGFWLCLVGLVLLHVSTNVLNDYYDYQSGIDLVTQRTPYNGGSGLLVEGLLNPRQAWLLGVSAFALAVPIGAYLVSQIGWPLLPLFLLGTALVFGNSSHATRLGYGVGELSAGLGLGALPVYGSAWVIHGQALAEFALAAVPSCLWVANLLFLNEFPDEAADCQGGRKTLVIQLGYRKAWVLYALLGLSAFLWIAACIVLNAMPLASGLVLLALPWQLKAIRLSQPPNAAGGFLTAQAANVTLTLTAHCWLAAGYLLA